VKPGAENKYLTTSEWVADGLLRGLFDFHLAENKEHK
jgi:hypothetical protein